MQLAGSIDELKRLASDADAHFQVEKQLVDGGAAGTRTRTHTLPLTRKQQRIDELALMLGTSGKAGESGADQLLREAEGFKGVAR